MRTADSSLTGKDPQPRPGDQVGVEPEAVRDQLAHILASPEFKAADRNRRFLRYVVEEALAGRGDRIKAYNVAVGVFGRDTGFDPQTDPIVRIEASRLRRSLEHYYIVAGQDDRVRIEIPKGGYVPVFGYAAGCSTKHESAPPEPASALAARDEEPPILAHRGEARASPSAVPASLSSSWHIPTSAAGLSMALGLLMTVALGLGLWFSTADGPDAVAGASNPSIIVLPFESLSAEPAGDNLAKGITEEITIGLEQFQELFVYALETGARFTPGAGYEQVHWDLGVRYILEGSVRQNQDVVRVTARLIDATSGVQLWASAYEKAGRSADALFRLQSDIARAVVGELAQPFGVIAIADLQLIREKPPETLSAYECVLQVVHYYRHMSPERVETARNCLERATASEPNYADAWAMLSMNYLDQVRLLPSMLRPGGLAM